MKSFNFPKMISKGSADLLSDKAAIRSNLNLLFHSECGELFGDPYYGSLIKKYLFEQSSGIVLDLLIDAIYTTILIHIPQVYVKRKDISVSIDKNALVINILYIFFS